MDNQNGQNYGSHIQRKGILVESFINYTTRYTERPAGVHRGAAGGALPNLPLPPAGAVRVRSCTPEQRLWYKSLPVKLKPFHRIVLLMRARQRTIQPSPKLHTCPPPRRTCRTFLVGHFIYTASDSSRVSLWGQLPCVRASEPDRFAQAQWF